MANVRSPERNFFDLPPEIRNNIYHQLFDGQKVDVCAKDIEYSEYRRQQNERIHPRDRRMGLNIIYVSKQCLQEARPILLSTAEFGVDLSYMYTGRRGRSNSQTWPRNVQGFSEAEFTYIRKLEIPYPRSWRGSALTEMTLDRLFTMPSLHSLIVRLHGSYSCMYGLVDYIKDVSKKGLLKHVINNVYFTQIPKIADHVQRAAGRTHRTAQFLLRWDSELPTRTASGLSIRAADS